ncbi:MAG TPA: hypothetical protein VGO71_18585 [Baekduia sp.]|jgi:hypothetical protein|nr:hypothetical protein [Baekduia sp.]
MPILGHVAGMPVEETLLGFAPLGVAGAGALAAYATQRARALLRRRRRPRAAGRL